MSYKKSAICLKVSTVAVLLSFFQFAVAQKIGPEFTAAVEARQKTIGQNLVVLVANKDSLLYQKEWGGFNQKTVAPIASASKWFTAALILQLVDEGKLNLDDKVVKYLPYFEKYGKNYITIRHCLTHMTGIKEEGRLGKFWNKGKYNTLDEEVQAIAALEIGTNPGTEFRYGGIGLNIAGRIAEVVTKKRFDMLIRQKLFIPLGMRQTTFSTIDASPPNPSGGAKSTAADYTKFLQMLLNKGRAGGVQILSENAVAQLETVQASGAVMKGVPAAAEGFSYALGNWVLFVEAGNATAAASPGLFGTWPMIDFCRGYACIFFVKNFLGEQKSDAYMQLKKELDKSFIGNCK